MDNATYMKYDYASVELRIGAMLAHDHRRDRAARCEAKIRDVMHRMAERRRRAERDKTRRTGWLRRLVDKFVV